MSDSSHKDNATKTVKQVCKCENCGNEAEMVVTCALESITSEPENAAGQSAPKNRVKGTGTCTSCGNEADMWIDI